MRVFPELVVGRDDDFEAGPWRVREGSTRRGGASCDLAQRVIEVPLGDGETARAVRAHELMHARVSPFGLEWAELFPDAAPRALECAEELRTNTLLARLGFAVDLLVDGSERAAGRRLAEDGDWSQAVCFWLAVIGTGAERAYLAGVRAARPTWVGALRAVRTRALAIMSSPTALLASTARDERGVPRGYARH
ncbi:MAG: hypothetical protein ACRDV0_01650, partial [Acidimicrobiales bacterium]